MSLTINTAASTVPSATVTARPPLSPAVRQDVAQLAQALGSGNVSDAKAAYVELAKQAPAGATLQPGSPFAQLGKALAQGDLDAAKTAFGAMVQQRREGPVDGGPVPAVQGPATATTTPTGTGNAGALINEVA